VRLRRARHPLLTEECARPRAARTGRPGPAAHRRRPRTRCGATAPAGVAQEVVRDGSHLGRAASVQRWLSTEGLLVVVVVPLGRPLTAQGRPGSEAEQTVEHRFRSRRVPSRSERTHRAAGGCLRPVLLVHLWMSA
jgi:hypothetical protein